MAENPKRTNSDSRKRTLNEWAEIVGAIGVAALIGGYIKYSSQGELLMVNKIILIAGGVLVLAAVFLGFGGILNFFSQRSSKLGTNTTVLAVAVLAILGVLNYLGSEHHKRFDLTTEKLFTLSDQTKKTLSGLTEDVTIVRFANQADPQLNDLMTEYKNLSPHFKFQNIDPREKPEVARQYGVTRMGDVVIASGQHRQNLEPTAEGMFSEEDVTSAIIKVTRNKIKMVCFVTGHGEKSLSDDSATGYTLIDQGLKREGYNTDSVNLVTSNGVPSTCDLLVIAGPTQAFFPQEEMMVSKYLDGAGKVLIQIDPETDPKLDDIFQAWNIAVGSNVVVDASGAGQLIGAGPAIPLVLDYGDSPITKTLKGGMTFFPLARTVAIADKNKADPQAVQLLLTSQRSFTIPNLKQKEVKFDPKTDTAGPLSLGVSASRMAGDATARLTVIGDSDFPENQYLAMQHNGDLFYNTIDWLAQDENLISIRPKSVTNRHVTLTDAQAVILRWLDLFFLPGIVILAGVTIWWKRR